MNRQFLTLTILVPAAAWAQQWEFGVTGAFGVYKNAQVGAAAGSVSAGMKSGPAFGVVGTHNTYRHFSGEGRYTYRFGDLKLADGSSVNLAAESHALHYDLLVHARPTGAAVRPYVALGAGIKYFRGTGREPIVQPLSDYALLTRASEVKPLVSFGAGVKFAVSPKVLLRLDVRDYATPVPTDLIAPRRAANVTGWLHDLVPMVGVGFQF